MEQTETMTTQVVDRGLAISIEITRGQRGTYGWTIKVDGVDLNQVLDLIRTADDTLQSHFIDALPE